MTAKIITEHVYPPIPWRGNDWSAHREGDEEETMRVGWGETKEKAIADLLLLEADAEDEAHPAAAPAAEHRRTMMNENQIKHMVDRFLSWKLPEEFRPDAGISFKAEFNEHTAHPMKHEPSGTNLFDSRQAEAMVRYIIDGMPIPTAEHPSSPSRSEVLEEALEKIRRTPSMPFPDPGAHSAAAWGRAVYLAWKQIQGIAAVALKDVRPDAAGEKQGDRSAQ